MGCELVDGPDFMIVGAARAGTSWLKAALEVHPDIWMTPVKELHYFSKKNLTRTFLSSHERKRAGFWKIKQWRESPAWRTRYWFGRRNDSWYLSLFASAKASGKLAGEATPAYSLLSTSDLLDLKKLCPNLKLIFQMRDPVSRSWSGICKGIRDGRISSTATSRDMIEFLGSDSRSDYLGCIQRMESVFDPSFIKYTFFDEVVLRPSGLLDDVSCFLRVSPYAFGISEARNRASVGQAVPEDLRKYLVDRYAPMVEALALRFGSYPSQWLQEYARMPG